MNWAIGRLSREDSFVANALVRGSPPALWLVARVGGLRKLQDDAFAWCISSDGSVVVFTRDHFLAYRRVVAGPEIWAYNFRSGQTHQLITAQGRKRYWDPK